MRNPHNLKLRPPRHRIRIPCQVVRMRDFKLVADSIVNLSLGGILVGPSDPVLTGEPLFISFKLPCSGEWIDSDAVVARVVHGRRDEDETRQLGVRFGLLSPSAIAAVRAQIRRAPPVSPFVRYSGFEPGPTIPSRGGASAWVRSAMGRAAAPRRGRRR